jgi:hypothetical protein
MQRSGRRHRTNRYQYGLGTKRALFRFLTHPAALATVISAQPERQQTDKSQTIAIIQLVAA